VIPHRVDAYQKWWLDNGTSRVPSEAPVPHPRILKNVQTPPQVNTLSFSQIYRVKGNRMVEGVGMSKRNADDVVDNLADGSRPFKRRCAELPKSKMHWMKNLDHMVMGEFSRQRRRGGGSQVSKEQRKKRCINGVCCTPLLFLPCQIQYPTLSIRRSSLDPDTNRVLLLGA